MKRRLLHFFMKQGSCSSLKMCVCFGSCYRHRGHTCHWGRDLVALQGDQPQEAIHRYKYSKSGGFPLAPVEKLSMIKTKEGIPKLFIERGGSNTLSQEVGMGQCCCWGSAAPSLTKAEELWDQGSQIPPQHTGAPQSPSHSPNTNLSSSYHAYLTPNKLGFLTALGSGK